MRARKSGVAQESGAARENLLVGRLDMGVSSNHGAHAAIQQSRDGHFLGRGFGVEIDQNQACVLAEPLNFGQNGMEGVFQGRHERAALEVDDSDRRKPVELKEDTPLPWRAGRIIQWPHEPGFALQ